VLDTARPDRASADSRPWPACLRAGHERDRSKRESSQRGTPVLGWLVGTDCQREDTSWT